MDAIPLTTAQRQRVAALIGTCSIELSPRDELAGDALRAFAEVHGVPVTETQAGKGALPWDHPLQLGALGVTGSPGANAMASEADVVVAVGTRLQDFMTGSHSLFKNAALVNLNVNAPNVVTTGPASIDPGTGKPYGMRFPVVSIADFVNVQKALAESLGSFASTVLAAYKCPKEYVFVEALPKTPNGKVKRGDLKSLPSAMERFRESR